jgi:hypothetical protein
LIEKNGILRHVFIAMRRNVAILTPTLREALQQASHNLEKLRLVNADQDTKVAQLIRDLRSVIPIGESEREAHISD